MLDEDNYIPSQLQDAATVFNRYFAISLLISHENSVPGGIDLGK